MKFPGRRFGAIALGALLAASLARADDERKTSPTVARETAESNAKTPAGRRYESALESSLDTWLKRAIDRCGKGVSPEDAVSFEVFVRISDRGEAEEVVVTPETAVSRCAERDFRDARYPHPPEEGWWVRVPIELK
ncbi:MAG TPA: hypothetical protein VMN82_04820 [Thermoanaerobaculia bacterium]|nr:hypothetical protein [Thermoanaerobaculia bacterium]